MRLLVMAALQSPAIAAAPSTEYLLFPMTLGHLYLYVSSASFQTISPSIPGPPMDKYLIRRTTPWPSSTRNMNRARSRAVTWSVSSWKSIQMPPNPQYQRRYLCHSPSAKGRRGQPKSQPPKIQHQSESILTSLIYVSPDPFLVLPTCQNPTLHLGMPTMKGPTTWTLTLRGRVFFEIRFSLTFHFNFFSYLFQCYC